jgi:hypothetical protein
MSLHRTKALLLGALFTSLLWPGQAQAAPAPVTTSTSAATATASPAAGVPQADARAARACARPTLTRFVEVMNELDNASMSSFLSSKAAGSPCWIDWSDDGCSWSPDSGSTYNFLKSCKRHDFGYRNSKRAESWYGRDMWRWHNKAVADTSFHRDMTDHCFTRSESEVSSCLEYRTRYYNIVAGLDPSTTGSFKYVYQLP